LGLGLFSAGLPAVQEASGEAKIIGDWDLEVNAGEEVFFLFFSIEKGEEGWSGSISESSGFFPEVPLENLEWDGHSLLFEMNIPTPPDGYENLVRAELEWVEGKLEGSLTVPSLGISAPAVATKKQT